jgi:hypothetical protein
MVKQKLKKRPLLQKIKENLFPSQSTQTFAMVQDARHLPKAVLFRDSFFTKLVPFFAPHFRRSVYYWQYKFDCAVIDQEKPDIVIQQIAERELMKIQPTNPPEIQPASHK